MGWKAKASGSAAELLSFKIVLVLLQFFPKGCGGVRAEPVSDSWLEPFPHLHSSSSPAFSPLVEYEMIG